MDKYSTVIFNPDIECELATTSLFTVQPVPDYVRWMATGGEMHYLPLEKIKKIKHTSYFGHAWSISSFENFRIDVQSVSAWC